MAGSISWGFLAIADCRASFCVLRVPAASLAFKAVLFVAASAFLAGLIVAVPPVGGVVVRALQEGASVAEAAAAAEQLAGEPVNVAGFVDRLRQLGLIASPARAAMQLPRTAAAMTWQFLLFLRTDLYAVLAAATGCHNLWRVKALSLRQALRTLTPAQARELSVARPRDLAVAAWFRWLWLAGFLLAASWFSWFGLPLLSHLLAWAVPGLATGPATTRFWLSAACTAILLWRYGIPALLTLGRAAAIQARHAREPREKGVGSWRSKSPASRRSRQQLKEAQASESLVR